MKNRKYGLIKNKAGCEGFLNKLYEAAQSVGSYPFKYLSGYAYLNAAGSDAEQKAMSALYKGGIVQEVMSDNGQNMVMYNRTMYASETSGFKADNSASAALTDDLYIIVSRPLDTSEGGPDEGETYDDGWSDYLPRVEIVAFYKEQQTPEATEQNPDPEPVTVRRRLSLHLGSNNSGVRVGYNYAGLAYEITPTIGGDVLVKLAWCLPDIDDTEDGLKHAMSGISIFNYKCSNNDGDTYIYNGCNGHSDEVFGMGGPCGGFLIHRMHSGANAFGITVFNGKDHTPLYTWCDGAGPWDKAEFVNRTNDGSAFGRIITKDKVADGSDEYRVKMTALAPVACASASNYAKTAKWMPQGWHDYSYFDKSGHIYLKTTLTGSQAGNTPVFFADHGLYLHDGALSDYNLTDRGLPDANPENLITVTRPDLPDLMPHADRFYAYFDSRDGITNSGWMNYFDSEYDMRFVGPVTRNQDGSVRFINRASNPAVGWCKALLSCVSAQEPDFNRYWGSMAIAVVRLSSNNDVTQWIFMPFVMGAVPGDDNRTLFEDISSGSSGFHRAYTMGFAGAYLNNSQTIRYGQSYFRDENSTNSWSGINLPSDKTYIVVCDDTYESNYRYVYFYEINSDGTYTDAGYSYNMGTSYSDRIDEHELALRYYIGGYHLDDSGWRSTYLQGAPGESQVSPNNYVWPSGNSANTTIDVKFLALADGHNWGWRQAQRFNINKAEILSYLADKFK